MGFDVAAQNIFAAQKTLETKVATILQRITQMQSISCTSGQVPLIQVGMLAMDSASEPVQLDFTNKYTELIEPFKALRNRGPFVLNGATIKAYADRFKSQPSDSVKVHSFYSGQILTSKSNHIVCTGSLYIYKQLFVLKIKLIAVLHP